MIVLPNYRGFRIEIVPQLVDGAWNAGVRILSHETPHIEQVTCQRATVMEAEHHGELWARRWVDCAATRTRRVQAVREAAIATASGLL